MIKEIKMYSGTEKEMGREEDEFSLKILKNCKKKKKQEKLGGHVKGDPADVRIHDDNPSVCLSM